MKILAIDTSTEACSVALLVGDATHSIFEICPQQHSQRVLPMIDELLTTHQIDLNELDCIAYGRGPGSFTGVRIATGVVQGLALGADLRVAEISTMAAMAQQVFEAQGCTQVQVLIDARMQEVYFGEYHIVDGIAQEAQAEAVLEPQEAFTRFTKVDNVNTLLGHAGTGWQAYQEVLKVEVSPQVLYPDAKFMIPLAVQAYQRDALIDVNDIKPTYLRDKVTWQKLPGK